jgi:hypothetical protein
VDEVVTSALERDRTIDITTLGRRSGDAHRIEIWFHNVDGTIYITGLPGRRGWYANIAAHPEFTFHLKETAQADLPARALRIEDEAERREVLAKILDRLDRSDQIDEWVARAPLVEVEFL